MKATELNQELTRIAKIIHKIGQPEFSVEEIEDSLNKFPTGPYWNIADFIMKEQCQGRKI